MAVLKELKPGLDEKTTDYADDTDKEKTMRDSWLRLGRAGDRSALP